MRMFILACVVLFLSSCASALRGTVEDLRVVTHPSNAELRLSNGAFGRSPATFIVPRKEKLIINISKEGYYSTVEEVRPKVRIDGALPVAGNLVFGPVGVVAGVIDISQGAMFDLDPNPVYVILQEEVDLEDCE